MGQLPNKIKAMTVIAGGTIPTLFKLGQISVTQAEVPTAQPGEELVKMTITASTVQWVLVILSI